MGRWIYSVNRYAIHIGRTIDPSTYLSTDQAKEVHLVDARWRALVKEVRT